MSGRDQFQLLMSERDVTHKLWTWLKREALGRSDEAEKE